MKSSFSTKASEDTVCCITQCRKTFKTNGQNQVNNYKCKQPKFSVQDMWKVRQQKRNITVRNYL